MKDDKRQIKTTKLVYPQIYAYTLPERVQNTGWQKIGYTEQADVRKRIEQQVHTAGVNERYELLWSAPAFYLPMNNTRTLRIMSYIATWFEIILSAVLTISWGGSGFISMARPNAQGSSSTNLSSELHRLPYRIKCPIPCAGSKRRL